MARIVKGDALKAVRFKLWGWDPTTGLKTAEDLTNATVDIRYKIDEGTVKERLWSGGGISIPSPATQGFVDMDPVADSWDAAGIAHGRLYVTSASKTGKTFKFKIVVEDDNYTT